METKQLPDAQMRKIISKYLIDGNEEKFVDQINRRFGEIRGLRRYIK